MAYYTDAGKYLLVCYKHAFGGHMAHFYLGTKLIQTFSPILHWENMTQFAINRIFRGWEGGVIWNILYTPPVTTLISIVWIIAITVGGREITMGLNYSTMGEKKYIYRESKRTFSFRCQKSLGCVSLSPLETKPGFISLLWKSFGGLWWMMSSSFPHPPPPKTYFLCCASQSGNYPKSLIKMFFAWVWV